MGPQLCRLTRALLVSDETLHRSFFPWQPEDLKMERINYGFGWRIKGRPARENRFTITAGGRGSAPISSRDLYQEQKTIIVR